VTRLPVVSGRGAVKAFERDGWRQVPRRRGSHILLVKRGIPWALTVPDHKELGRGTLRTLIGEAGLTVARFTELLDQ
jgi:predicted RNA binding protein YcfA (HicA-like mRNA interferase family)